MRKGKIIIILFFSLISTLPLYGDFAGYFRTTMLFSHYSSENSFTAMNLLSLQFDSQVSENINFHIEGYCYLIFNPANPFTPATPFGCPNFNKFYFSFYPTSSITMILGKNTIHWGTNQLLRTQDYFVPSPLINFTEEESGRYLFNISYSSSIFSMEGVITPISSNRSQEGAQVSILAGPLELKANFFHREPSTQIAGLNWNLSISPILLYGEETYFLKEKEYRLTAGISFSIGNSIFYLEYLYNRKSGEISSTIPNTTIFPVLNFTSRNYLAGISTITISPINQFQFYGLIDLNQKDWFGFLEFDHNLTQSLIFSTGVLYLRQKTPYSILKISSLLIQFRYWF